MVGASQKISNYGSPRRTESGSSSGADQIAAAGGQSLHAMTDSAQIRALLAGPEGRALLQILQADGGAGLRAAAEALKKGDQAGVRAALSPLLAGTEAERLTRSLEAKL